MKKFATGTVVKTNEAYYKRYKRVVTGTVVLDGVVAVPEGVALVRWDHQEGDIVKSQQGKSVPMDIDDLIELKGAINLSFDIKRDGMLH